MKKVWLTIKEIIEWIAPLGALNFKKIYKIIKEIWR
jgi:hypothetical protein